jgi:hypothetical protein
MIAGGSRHPAPAAALQSRIRGCRLSMILAKCLYDDGTQGTLILEQYVPLALGSGPSKCALFPCLSCRGGPSAEALCETSLS